MAGEKVIDIMPHLVEVGPGFRFDPDQILDAAKGQEFTTLAIIAQKPDGSIWVSSTANAGEALVLMEKAKRVIVFGEDV